MTDWKPIETAPSDRACVIDADAIASRIAADVFGYNPVRHALNSEQSDEFHGFVQDVILMAIRSITSGEGK